MTAQIKALRKSEQATYCLATVIHAEQGFAKIIKTKVGTLAVYAQATSVAYLHHEDEVLYVMTEHGAYVLAKTAMHPIPIINSGENGFEIRLADAFIHLSPQGDIVIKNPQALLKINASGDIILQAKNIKQIATETISLN